MTERRILVWFRNDLRLHDNEMLAEAVAKSDSILPVYFFDPRHFELTEYQALKTGTMRTRFLIESIQDLRNSLKAYGGDILVVKGRPEELIPEIVMQYEVTEVYHHREVAAEETQVSSAVEDALWKMRINLRHFIGHTLYNKEDLPFPIKDIPDSFQKFRKKTEREALVKACFDTPELIKFVKATDYGSIPTVAELLPDEHIEFREEAHNFIGGETQSLQVLARMLSRQEEMKRHKVHMFSHLSPWLALGCLSPRKVYWTVKSNDQLTSSDAMLSKVMLGLLWRDYFRFMFKKYGNVFFRRNGFVKKVPYDVAHEASALRAWKDGRTGNVVVDKIMIKLKTSGMINNVARNVAALYLLQVLKLDWTLGAAYFEEQLIDYAPASNWGNWAILAGVGNEQPQKTQPDFDAQLRNYERQDAIAPFAA